MLLLLKLNIRIIFDNRYFSDFYIHAMMRYFESGIRSLKVFYRISGGALTYWKRPNIVVNFFRAYSVPIILHESFQTVAPRTLQYPFENCYRWKMRMIFHAQVIQFFRQTNLIKLRSNITTFTINTLEIIAQTWQKIRVENHSEPIRFIPKSVFVPIGTHPSQSEIFNPSQNSI